LRTNKISLVTLLALLALISIGFPSISVHATASVITDQSDYLVGSTVTIYGSGFSRNGAVAVSVTDPNDNMTSWSVASDSLGGFTTIYLLDHVFGNYVVTATDGLNSASTTFHDASEAANLDQCRNDAVGLTPAACNPGTPAPLGWANGNAQPLQAHWIEGQFIAYRVVITGLAVGAHTLDFHYDIVHDGAHAIDYIGSVNATETFSTSPTVFNANSNNPCSDVLPSSQCIPASPSGFVTVPAASLIKCDASSATFSGSQSAGKIFIYGPTGTTLESFTYTAQNVATGTGKCMTSVELSFNSAGSTVVIAWGGHIASQANWGKGNSAVFINGSPYHMSLDLLDGASTGAQDRALAVLTSAIFFLPSVTTTVINNSSGLPVISTMPLGSSAHDNAFLSGAATNAGGNVTYRFYNNGLCSGTPLTSQTVTVTNGVIPPSSSTGALAPGAYSYNATYSGDSIDFPLLPNSACEPFVVNTGSSGISTMVFDASTNAPWSGTETTGAKGYDTASVTTSDGFTATGTVTYTFYKGDCSGTVVSTETVTLTGSGSVPNSSPTAVLTAGSYAFQAVYSGDSNYSGSTSPCESFTVTGGTIGAAVIPVDKLTLLAPFIALALVTLIAVGATVLIHRRRIGRKASQEKSTVYS